jgi:bisphosphoglycerate-dependent phosphoglycerate mutase
VLSFAIAMQAEELIQTGYFEQAEGVVLEGLALSTGKILARECQFTSMLARVKRRTGRFGEAIRVAEIALELSDELGLPVQQVLQRLSISDTYLDLGAIEQAQVHLQRALHLIQEGGLTAFDLLFETLQARSELLNGQPKAALTRLEKIQSSLNQAPIEHRLMFITTLAQTQLKVGNFAIALQTLADFSAPTWLEARAQSIQIQTMLLSQPKNTDILEQRIQTTTTFLKSNRIPKLEAFQLQITLKRAYGFLRQEKKLQNAEITLEKYRDELVQSLESEPQLQQCFLELYTNA